MHGGSTPIEHGLFSKYPDAVVGGHMEAAKKVSAMASLEKSIPVLIAIMSLWVERGIVFAPKNYLATCMLMSKITAAVETYERLSNPGRSGDSAKEQIGEYLEALKGAASDVWSGEEDQCEE